MAEFVQEAVDKLQQDLSQIKCLTNEERRIITKKVTRLEYKTRKRTKNRDDCTAFIDYLKDLLTLLKARKGTAPMSKVCQPFITKIHGLYDLCETRFPEDVSIFLDHARFCKENKQHRRASKVFEQMLRFHGHVPELWVLAALNEIERHDQTSARAMMQQCVRMNTTSRLARIESFRLELQIARKNEEPNGNLAEKISTFALMDMPDDLDLLLDMIEISSGFDFYTKQRETLLKKLQEEHVKVPLIADFRARLLLPDRKRKLQRLSKEEENRFLAVYEQAVIDIPTMEMWSLYAKACIGLVSVARSDEDFWSRIDRTLAVLKQASDKNLLDVDMFQMWVVLLLNLKSNASEAGRVSEIMVQRFPQKAATWKLLLSIRFQTLASANDVSACLKKALLEVPEKESWCLWEAVAQYLDSVSSDLLEPLLQKACERPTKEVSMPAKLMYLQWTSLNKGIKATRALYKKLSIIKPVPLQFFLQYAKQELLQERVKMKKVRRAYEDAISDYGKTEPDLWLHYIRMELSQPEGNPAQAGNLHLRASLNLSSDALKHSFLREYDAVVCSRSC